MDSSNGTESSGIRSNGTESSGVESNTVGSSDSEVGNESKTNPSGVSQTNENVSNEDSNKELLNMLLSIGYKDVAMDEETPVAANFSGHNYQNLPTDEIREDIAKLTTHNQIARECCDFLEDQQSDPKNKHLEQKIDKADNAFLKEVKDSSKLIDNLKDELSKR